MAKTQVSKKYYLFLDESGHHGLKTIEQDFPIFLLCGCPIEQNCFHKEFTQKFNKLKLIATKILYPKRENLAFRIIEPKIYRQFPDGDYLGYGLKIFP